MRQQTLLPPCELRGPGMAVQIQPVVSVYKGDTGNGVRLVGQRGARLLKGNLRSRSSVYCYLLPSWLPARDQLSQATVTLAAAEGGSHRQVTGVGCRGPGKSAADSIADLSLSFRGP
jgi:hypothetical protein